MKPTPRTTTVHPHPLESLALEFFDRHEALNVAKLASLLGGQARHHKTLASEILKRMEERDTVWVNDQGDYRLSDPFAGMTKVNACGFRYPSPKTHPASWHSEPVSKLDLLEHLQECLDSAAGPPAAFIVAVVPIGRNGVVNAEGLVEPNSPDHG